MGSFRARGLLPQTLTSTSTRPRLPSFLARVVFCHGSFPPRFALASTSALLMQSGETVEFTEVLSLLGGIGSLLLRVYCQVSAPTKPQTKNLDSLSFSHCGVPSFSASSLVAVSTPGPDLVRVALWHPCYPPHSSQSQRWSLTDSCHKLACPIGPLCLGSCQVGGVYLGGQRLHAGTGWDSRSPALSEQIELTALLCSSMSQFWFQDAKLAVI